MTQTSEAPGQSQKGRQKRKPKPVTRAWLEASGLYYLGRFTASEKRFRGVMTRKMIRRQGTENPITPEQKQWLEDLIRTFTRLDYLNDGRFAEQKIRQLVARGKPIRFIRQALQRDGITSDTVEALLLDGEDGPVRDHAALINFVRRRRFGPFARTALSPKPEDKQMAAIARAGFPYDLARLVLASETEEELLERLEGL